MKSRVGLTVAALTVLLSPRSSHPQQPPAVPASIFFRIIVVESADAARRVLDQLAAGENFVALARKVSVDPSAASNGGLVGPVLIVDLRPRTANRAGGASRGELSGVVRLPTGFAILKTFRPRRQAVPSGGLAAAAPPVWAIMSPRWSAAGSVKYVFDISGLHRDRSEPAQVACRADADETCLRSVRCARSCWRPRRGWSQKTLSAPSRAVAPLDLAQAYFLKGQLHSYRGQDGAGHRGVREGDADRGVGRPDLRPQLDEALGVAHLHKAEMENGVFHAPGDRCLLSEHMARQTCQATPTWRRPSNTSRSIWQRSPTSSRCAGC